MQTTLGGDRSGTHLHAIRGVSALVVMLSHLRALTLVDFEEASQRGATIRAFYLASGLGHEAVMVFFVLSGFFISASVLRSLRSGRWIPARYALARFSRLYVVLIPALMFGFVCDRVGLATFPYYKNYQAGYSHMVPGDILSNLDGRTALVNLSFLQTIHGPVWGSNGPLWSLACEFWYYVAFPLLALALWKGVFWRRALCLVGLGLVLALIGNRAPGFGIWLMGAALVVLPPKEVAGTAWATALAWTLFAVVVVAGRLQKLGAAADWAVGSTFALLLYCILNRPEAMASQIYRAGAEFLSGFSFTLYVVHVPLLILLSAAWLGDGVHLQPTASGFAKMTAIGLVAIATAVGLWALFERKTDRVRTWLESRLLTKQITDSSI